MGKLARNHSGKKGEVIQSSKNNRTQPPDSLAPPDHSTYKYTVCKITRLFFCFSQLESYHGSLLAKYFQCCRKYSGKFIKSKLEKRLKISSGLGNDP